MTRTVIIGKKPEEFYAYHILKQFQHDNEVVVKVIDKLDTMKVWKVTYKNDEKEVFNIFSDKESAQKFATQLNEPKITESSLEVGRLNKIDNIITVFERVTDNIRQYGGRTVKDENGFKGKISKVLNIKLVNKMW